MRKVNIGTNNYTEVYATDEPKFNANHKYEVRNVPSGGAVISEDEIYAKVSFQKGPIKENGVNGCHNEDLIAIVIDRLECLNQGDFRCKENSIAITKLKEALMWLNKRTLDRRLRRVEGTSQK
jgi:hypothetical protein